MLVYYTKIKSFNNFKSYYNTTLKNTNYNIEYLDKIKLKTETLLNSSHIFIDKNENEHIIKIFGTYNSIKNLSDKDFT